MTERTMSRVRYLTGPETPGPNTQAAEVIAFCEANGLDAGTIPAQGCFRIVDDATIEYREIQAIHGDHAELTEWRSVPLVSPPWEHGVATYATQEPRP